MNLDKEIEETKTFNYNVYYGQGGGDNAISFEEAKKEIKSLIRKAAMSCVPEGEHGNCSLCNSNKNWSQARKQMIKNVEEL